MAIDPLSLATDGFIVSEGYIGGPITLVTDGFIIEIEPDGDGGFKVTPQRDRKGQLRSGGGPGADLSPEARRQITSQEDEEIMTIITIFLNQIEKHRWL